MKTTRAFTLMEVLVAMGVILLLSGTVMGFLWRMNEVRNRLSTIASAQSGAAVLFERLESDVLTALAGDGRAGSGVVGSATDLKILSRGVAMGLAPIGEAAALGDLQTTEYSFDANGGAVMARRTAIVRSEGHATDPEVMVEGVAYLRFRYFSGRAWTSSFDSAEGLPVAIEIGLWLRSRGAAFESDAETGAEADLEGIPVRQPDRLRIISVPDGPVAAWKEGPA